MLLKIGILSLLCTIGMVVGLGAATGTTQTYLHYMPLTKVIDLYEQHPDVEREPVLKEYAEFFKAHQPLFDTIIQREEANAGDYYIVYRGVNGQRLVFDTLEALYVREHQRPLPQEFVLFRDPDDPAVLTDNIQALIEQQWPPLTTPEKQQLLSVIFERSIPLGTTDLLWDVMAGDLEPERDLTGVQQAQVRPFIDSQLRSLRRYLRALGDEKWADRYLTDIQKERVSAISEKLKKEVPEALIKKFEALMYHVDYTPDLRPRNISVNLSLFAGCVLYDRGVGLYPSKDECTPLYWFAPQLGYHRKEKIEEQRQALLEPILKRRGIPESEVKNLEEIYAELRPEDDQLLFQIMIPKKALRGDKPLIDTMAYISHRVGRPAYYLGSAAPSQMLDRYAQDMTQIPGFLQLQGRLLFTRDGLLNPESGIRIYTYYLPGASQVRIAEYKKQLQRWAERR